MNEQDPGIQKQLEADGLLVQRPDGSRGLDLLAAQDCAELLLRQNEYTTSEAPAAELYARALPGERPKDLKFEESTFREP
ncbi:hypothetical protein JW978_00985 [Candidatus Dojkabacteria bacterium]|nr:hypothetical protein [Candidatus Dojkabacteria bacterium]